jgi:hypothetical protein
MAKGNGAEALIMVEITDEPIIPGRPFTDKSTGMTRPPIAKQAAYLHSGARYPTPFKIIVPETGPYRPGMYLLAGDAFKAGEWDGLKFSDRNLQLVAAADVVAELQKLGGKAPLSAAA